MTIETDRRTLRPGIIPARLADLLQRAMARRTLAARPAKTNSCPDAEAENAGSQREDLPWWAVHHPALSFRGTRRRG
jgi:hypothetical protein